MKNWKKLLVVGVIVTSSQATASPFGNFGGNNFGGNKLGGSGFGSGCNDWPEWTPMYWMEKMMSSDKDCNSAYYPRSSAVPYGGYGAPSPYNTAYASPYGGAQGAHGQYGQQRYPANRYPANAYNGYSAYGNPYANSYANRGYAGSANSMPMMNRGMGGSPSYGRGSSGFPGFSQGLGQGFGQGFSPFSGRSGGFPSMSSFGGSGFNPFSSMGGGMSPMGFGSPMSPMGLGSPMSPMGFGSPMSPMGFRLSYEPNGFRITYESNGFRITYESDGTWFSYESNGFRVPMSSMSPMGFGSPMSSMNPMGGGFGSGSSSPFGMKKMNPFSGGGMGSPFSF